MQNQRASEASYVGSQKGLGSERSERWPFCTTVDASASEVARSLRSKRRVEAVDGRDEIQPPQPNIVRRSVATPSPFLIHKQLTINKGKQLKSFVKCDQAIQFSDLVEVTRSRVKDIYVDADWMPPDAKRFLLIKVDAKNSLASDSRQELNLKAYFSLR